MISYCVMHFQYIALSRFNGALVWVDTFLDTDLKLLLFLFLVITGNHGCQHSHKDSHLKSLWNLHASPISVDGIKRTLSEFQSLMRDDMSPLYLSLIFLFFTSLPSQVNKFGMFRYTNKYSWSACEFKMPWYQVLYCNRDTYYLCWVLTSGPLA